MGEQAFLSELTANMNVFLQKHFEKKALAEKKEIVFVDSKLYEQCARVIEEFLLKDSQEKGFKKDVEIVFMKSESVEQCAKVMANVLSRNREEMNKFEIEAFINASADVLWKENISNAALEVIGEFTAWKFKTLN